MPVAEDFVPTAAFIGEIEQSGLMIGTKP